MKRNLSSSLGLVLPLAMFGVIACKSSVQGQGSEGDGDESGDGDGDLSGDGDGDLSGDGDGDLSGDGDGDGDGDLSGDGDGDLSGDGDGDDDGDGDCDASGGCFDDGSPARSDCPAWKTCGPGYFVAEAGTGTSDRVCEPCPLGSVSEGSNGSACTPCPSGYYTPEVGRAECSTLPDCEWEETPVLDPQGGDAVCGPGSNVREAGTAADDIATSLVVDGAGNVMVVGTTRGNPEVPEQLFESPKILLGKFDSMGRHLFTKIVLSPEASLVHDMVADTEGHLLLVGESVTDGSAYGLLIWVDDQGQWVANVGIDGGQVPATLSQSSTVVYGAALDDEGALYVTGTTDGSVGEGAMNLGEQDIFVQKYQLSDRSLVWSRQYGGAGFDSGKSIAVDSAGLVYVLGETSSASFYGTAPSGASDMALLVIDQEDLDAPQVSLWGRGGADSPAALTVNDQGMVFLAGTSSDNNLGDIYLARTSAAHEQGWSEAFIPEGPSHDSAFDLALDAQGNPIVFAYTNGTSFAGQPVSKSATAVTLKVGSDGTPVWTSVEDWTHPVAGAVGPDGRLFLALTGNISDSSSSQLLVALIDWEP